MNNSNIKNMFGCENKVLKQNIAVRYGIRKSQQIVRSEAIEKKTTKAFKHPNVKKFCFE